MIEIVASAASTPVAYIVMRDLFALLRVKRKIDLEMLELAAAPVKEIEHMQRRFDAINQKLKRAMASEAEAREMAYEARARAGRNATLLARRTDCTTQEEVYVWQERRPVRFVESLDN